MEATSEAELAGQDAVAPLAQLARDGGRLGIDTEFMSEGRYRALLCLVQVVVDDPEADDGIRTALFDPRAKLDLTELAELLADPAVEVVLHAGRQDIAILRREWATEVRNVFDTQIAAGFAGRGAQTGYGNLIGAVLGLRVAKSASFTRWDRRPLTPEQLSYAREDVLHLLELTDRLQDALRASGRLEWAREECAVLEQATDERDPVTAWERLPRVGSLGPQGRAVARELAAWRERTAQSENRPVGSIIADPTLVELAKRQPRDSAGLEQIRGLHPPIRKRRGVDLLAAIERGREAEPIEREAAKPGLDRADAPLVALVEALIRQRTLAADLAYELVASRAELDRIVGAARRGEPEPDVRTLRGWRRELVGEDVRALLAGRRWIGVDAGGRIAVELRDEPAE